jgi:hypothetical protein
MNTVFPRRLKAVYGTFRRDKRIALHYRQGRWDQYEIVKPLDIRDAIHLTLEAIEKSYPGALQKAAAIDDRNWLGNKQRTRRYIAERADLIYIDSPHLIAQSEAVCGFHAPTNVPWKQVWTILDLACQGAGILYGSFSKLSLQPTSVA